jgi:hypothetical protein
MMRRELLRLLASGLVQQRGDGLHRPVNAPPPNTRVLGTQPGTTPAVVTANRVIVYGSNGGVFVYAGTPAPGNAPIAWMSDSLADPYGNALKIPGVGSSGMTGWSALSNGIMYVGTSSDTSVTAARISAPATGEVQITGNVGAADVPALLFFLSKVAGGGPIPVIQVGSIIENCGLTVLGPVNSSSGTPANPSLITTDAWNAMTLANGWGTPSVASYRLTNDGEVELAGELRQAAAPTSTTVATLPAGYRPAHTLAFAVGASAGVAGASPWMQVDSSGVVIVNNAAIASNPIILFSGRIPLGL